MSGELAVHGGELIDIAPNLTDDQFSKLAKSNNFLPRVQLFQSGSKLVKMGKMPQGHWGLVKSKDAAEDLGESFDCLVVQYRSKALDTSADKPVQYFDENSKEFMDVVERSEERDSGCMWGPEFLLWLPVARTFATLFCSSATTRNSADEIKQLHRRACTLGVRFIETKKYSWHGPAVSMCSTAFDIPDRNLIIAANERFIKTQEAEVVEDDVVEEVDSRAR